jgi:hypothetical protein
MRAQYMKLKADERVGSDREQSGSSLYRLIYVSDIAAYSIESIESTLQQILLQSYILNTRDGITGFLMTYACWYTQVIEGPRAAVEACYARIGRDTRHVGIKIKSRGVVGLRLFPQWSMCGLTLSARDASVQGYAKRAFNLDLVDASPQDVLRFLTAVSRRYNDQVDCRYRALRLV